MNQANTTSRVLKALTAALTLAAASLVVQNANAQSSSCGDIDSPTTCNSTAGCEWNDSTGICQSDGDDGSGDGGGQPGECAGGACGTPNNNGGGGCGCGGGSILVNNTDDGQTYEQSDDSDGDGIDDSLDNCVYTPNANQSDVDGDGVGDVCDDCVDTSDKLQAQNPCGDVWAEGDQGLATAAGVSNNLGQVIGEVCDQMCATDNTTSAPPATVGLTAPSTTNTGGSAAVHSSGSGGCTAAGVGTGGDAPVGLMLTCLGAVAIGVGRRRTASRKRA